MARRLWFIFAVLVTAACIGLGIWQLGRLAERRTGNAVAIAGRERPILDLTAQAGEVRAQRRVVARGTFDHAHEIILRGHLLTGAPGVQVVTPLRLAGSDSAVLVNRGFAPGGDGTTPDDPVPPEPGAVVIEGIAIPVPVTEDGGRPAERAGQTSWRRLDLEVMRSRLPYPVLDVYVLASPDTSRRGWPRRVTPPPLDEGPHLSYALQWFGIGGAVLTFGIFFILGVGRRAGSTVPPAPPAP